MGNFAKYMILLARTNPAAERKYDGLSFFLAPMTVAGIDPPPIRKLTGEYGFTQTYFNDARIPASCLMGSEGQGWQLAMKTLQYERGAEAGAAGGLSFVRIALEDMIESLTYITRDDQPLLQDPVVRDELMQLIISDQSISIGEKRATIQALTNDFPWSLPLSTKYRWT